MSGTLEFNFSHRFPGVVWNLAAAPMHHTIVVEWRDHQLKQVRFSAWNYQRNLILWENKQLDEEWWVSLTGAVNDLVLLTVYSGAENPRQVGIVACDLETFAIRWWKNDFSIMKIANDFIIGLSTKFGSREEWLSLATGEAVSTKGSLSNDILVSGIARPERYQEGTAHFETIRKFLTSRLNLFPLSTLEYWENEAFIFLSYYVMEADLANYLLVLSRDGNVILREKIGERLKGIAFDTFFILEGCLFFVKNKQELVSYRIL